MNIKELLKKANELPDLPGVYTMYNLEKRVIYVGKAVNLKNRVTSYFRNTWHDVKTTQMISNVDNFEVIITSNEIEALVTEASLIKLHTPKYNLTLRNGKMYPFILVALNEGCPSVTIENDRKKKGTYFGPFMNREVAIMICECINKAFRLPVCKYKKLKKGCLNYQINRCIGYFCGHEPTESFDKMIKNICDVLNGNISPISDDLTAQMEKASENLEFELAIDLRERINALKRISIKQMPKIQTNRNADYIAYKLYGERCCVFMLRIRNGYIVGERCDIFHEVFTGQLLMEYIQQFYNEDTQIPNKIYIEEEYEWFPVINEWLKDRVSVPTFSQDVQLLNNAKHNAIERMLQYEGKTQKAQRMLDAFCDFAELEQAGNIEIYDISQLAGTDVVCGMISCREGQLHRDNYRKFKINQLLGFGDTDYMKEALTRRLERFKANDEKFMPLPNLIICDGGLAQIHALQQVLAEQEIDIKVIGFKKDTKHKTKAIVLSDGREKLLAQNQEVMIFCARLQDEVHRFAISFHSQLREKSTRESILTTIEGVGKVKAKDIYLHFKSIDKIRKATIEELTEIKGVNENLAQKILDTLNKYD